MPGNFMQWMWFVFYSGGSFGGWLLLAYAIYVIMHSRKA